MSWREREREEREGERSSTVADNSYLPFFTWRRMTQQVAIHMSTRPMMPSRRVLRMKRRGRSSFTP
jgi:hypothetical protein